MGLATRKVEDSFTNVPLYSDEKNSLFRSVSEISGVWMRGGEAVGTAVRTCLRLECMKLEMHQPSTGYIPFTLSLFLYPTLPLPLPPSHLCPPSPYLPHFLFLIPSLPLLSSPRTLPLTPPPSPTLPLHESPLPAPLYVSLRISLSLSL